VVQDAESYQKLLEAKDRMETIEGIKRGLESMKARRGKPASSEKLMLHVCPAREWPAFLLIQIVEFGYDD